MFRDAPPPDHYIDWTAWSWARNLIFVPLLLGLIVFLVYLIADKLDSGYRGRDRSPWWVIPLLTLLACASWILAFWGHYQLARHTEDANPWWWFVPVALAVLACVPLFNSGHTERRLAGAAMVSFAAIGILTAGMDMLNRAAASIPIGVTTLLVLIVAGVIVAAVQASKTRV